MKVLFIDSFEYVELIGIMQLSAVLKQHGHEAAFLDLKFEKEIHRAVARAEPDIIGYSVTTGKHTRLQKLNLELKRDLDFLAIFGGPHCTFFPDFIAAEGVDALCVGEGEHAMAEVADALRDGRPITGIPNIHAKSNGEIHRNDVRDLVQDLDSLPYPDRSLCDKYNHYRRMYMRYVMTGRGCPYACTFCFNHAFNRLYKDKGKITRRRTAEDVIGEVREVADTYGTRRFCFIDDTFTLNREWVLDFCEKYKKEVSLPFDVSVRANLMDEEVVTALKDAGCYLAAYSIESGNERIRNEVLNRNITEDKLVTTGRLLRKHRVKVQIQNIIALPDETLDTAMETLMLNARCKPTYAWASIYQPLPGTKLCDYATMKGYFDGSPDEVASYFSKSPLKMKDIRKLERFHHLFSICVDYPFLVPLIKLLINLPLKPLYRLLWLIHKTWYVVFKARWMRPYEFFLRD